MQPQRRTRLELIDALRAVALFGILQVNIQSFTWGAGDPLGYFNAPPSTADTLAYLLVASFVSTKFIGLFSFLFGFGFALQLRSLRRVHTDLADAKRTYRRRLWFLLAIGIAHGILLYFGDVLTAYAICGFILAAYAGARPARLARAARSWWIAFAVIAVLMIGLMHIGLRAVGPPADPAQIPPETRAVFALYSTGSYLEQLPQRAQDYIGVMLASLFLGLPMIVALFLTGTLAARLGWLAHPARHPHLWRNARRIGVAGLVVAAAGAWLNFQSVTTTPAYPAMSGVLLMLFGVSTLALYLALVMRWRDAAPMRAIVVWLAPAGRMPLTNYLMQSVLMGALLSGWGLGWGATLSHASLALLALTIVFVQVLASRAWIARFGTGPMEALWRRATYGAR
jgi:uncharacterized protein